MKWRKCVSLGLIVMLVCSLMACGQEDIASKDLMKDLPVNMQNNTQDDTEDVNSIVSSCISERPPETVTDEEMNEAAAEFAVRLFQNSMLMEMVPGEEMPNILVSPMSVFMALSMTANGAENETLLQMEQVLGMSVGNLNVYAADHVANLPEGKDYKLSMANSIWFRDDEERLTVEEAFLQKNKTYYGADVYKSAFDETTVKDINLWVEKETDGLIREIINKISEDTVMYLINALAFDAKWQEVYDTSDIWNGTFHVNENVEQEVEMLHSEEHAYLEDELAVGFIKYYTDQKYAFAALLPKEDVTLYQYVSNLTGAHLQELLANPENVPVDVTMPKFEVEYQTEMSEILKEMGMTDAFDSDKADLTGIGTSTRGNLFVNRVLHKTFLTLDELGTKAGAVTVVEVNDEAAVLKDYSKTVILDRPFLYMVIDCENNQPVFMGTVNYVKDYSFSTDKLCSYPLKENRIIEIRDRTEEEQLVCAEAEEMFYEDENTEYYFNVIKSHYIMVTYNNGNSEDIVTALNAGRATIADLDKFDIEYHAEPKK